MPCGVRDVVTSGLATHLTFTPLVFISQYFFFTYEILIFSPIYIFGWFWLYHSLCLSLSVYKEILVVYHITGTILQRQVYC